MSQPLEIRINGSSRGGHVLETQCLVDDSGIAANVAAALVRQLPLVRPEPVKPGRLAIVAAGSSVTDHLDEISGFDEIWAINGAFCGLIDIGLVPDMFFFMDPGPGCESLLTSVPQNATYLLSIACDPGMFDHIKAAGPRLIKVWFPDVRHEFNVANYPPHMPLVKGGTSALTRAPFLAYMCGWRDITLFGGDSSFGEVHKVNGKWPPFVNYKQYFYDPSKFACSAPPNIKFAEVGEIRYATNVQMMHQVANLLGITQLFGTMLKFQCGGLLNAMLNSPVSEPVINQDSSWKTVKRTLARPFNRIRRATGL